MLRYLARRQCLRGRTSSRPSEERHLKSAGTIHAHAAAVKNINIAVGGIDTVNEVS